MSTHTQGKLKVTHQTSTDHAFDLVTDYGVGIATCGKCQSEDSEVGANARRLANCWNSHDKLLEACTLVERAWVGDGVDMSIAVDACLKAIQKAGQP